MTFRTGRALKSGFLGYRGCVLLLKGEEGGCTCHKDRLLDLSMPCWTQIEARIRPWAGISQVLTREWFPERLVQGLIKEYRYRHIHVIRPEIDLNIDITLHFEICLNWYEDP